MIPAYYRINEESDIYQLWREHYGHDATAKHLEMAALEYLWRCRHKGQYRRDLEKVKVIVERLLAWTAPDVDQPHRPTINEALAVLAQHGWGVIPPTLPPREDTTPVLPFVATAPTVLAHCLRVDQQRQGVAVEREIVQHLLDWQIPCLGRYVVWKDDLARVSQGRYPVEEA